MSMDWFDQNAGGSGNPGVFFGQVGAKVVGTLMAAPKQTTFTDDKGKEQPRLIVELRASDGCTAAKGKMGADGTIQAGDEVTLWVKPGLMASAIRDAVADSGAKGLAEGDTIAVAFTENKDTGKIQPAKVYAAKYVPAKAAVSLDSLV